MLGKVVAEIGLYPWESDSFYDGIRRHRDYSFTHSPLSLVHSQKSSSTLPTGHTQQPKWPRRSQSRSASTSNFQALAYSRLQSLSRCVHITHVHENNAFSWTYSSDSDPRERPFHLCPRKGQWTKPGRYHRPGGRKQCPPTTYHCGLGYNAPSQEDFGTEMSVK